MSVFAWVLLICVSAFAIFEITTLILQIVKKRKEKKNKKEIVQSNDSKQ